MLSGSRSLVQVARPVSVLNGKLWCFNPIPNNGMHLLPECGCPVLSLLLKRPLLIGRRGWRLVVGRRAVL